MIIREWPKDERPREKLLLRGAKSLSDAELLAIFLRTGVRGKTAVDVAFDSISARYEIQIAWFASLYLAGFILYRGLPMATPCPLMD